MSPLVFPWYIQRELIGGTNFEEDLSRGGHFFRISPLPLSIPVCRGNTNVKPAGLKPNSNFSKFTWLFVAIILKNYTKSIFKRRPRIQIARFQENLARNDLMRHVAQTLKTFTLGFQLRTTFYSSSVSKKRHKYFVCTLKNHLSLKNGLTVSL